MFTSAPAFINISTTFSVFNCNASCKGVLANYKNVVNTSHIIYNFLPLFTHKIYINPVTHANFYTCGNTHPYKFSYIQYDDLIRDDAVIGKFSHKIQLKNFSMITF